MIILPFLMSPMLNTVNAGSTWYYDVSPVIYPAGVTGDWAAGLTDQTATGIAALTDNLVNNTNDVQTVIYTFTPHIRPGDGGAECTDGVPVTVTVNINPRPRIAVITDTELCYDDPAIFDITNPNTVHTGATWYYDVSPVIYPAGVTGDWAAGFTDLTVTGIAALTDNLLNSTSDVQTVIYTFTPHIRPGDGGAECTDGVPVTVTVNINPRPRIAVVTDQELCYDNPARFDVTNLNTVNTGAIWYYDVSPVIYPAGVTGDWAAGLTDQTATGIAALTDNLVNNTNDVQTVIYTFTPHIRPGDGGAECTDGVPVTVTVNINPRPRIAVITDTELCYDDPAIFDITNPNTVNTGAIWYYDVSPVIYPAGVTGDWAAGFTDLTVTGIAALTDNLVNNTSDVQTVVYTFTPHIRPGDGAAECTAGVPEIVTVNINPRPRIAVITDAELCYDNPARFDVTKINTVHTGAIWYYDVSPVIYPAGVTGDWAAGLTDQTATGIAALTDNLVNNTNDVQTVIYTFTPHIRPGDGGAECTDGVPVTVTVNINPRPRIAVVTDQELCYDNPASFDVTNLNTVNAGSTWYYDVSPVIYPAGVTGDWAAGLTDQTATGIAALTDNLVNNTNDVQTVIYTFTPHIRPGDGGAECTAGVPVTVTVNINPRPRIAVTTNGGLCYDDPATFDVTNPNTVHTGAIWYYDVLPVIYPAGVTGNWAAGLTDQTATGIAVLTDNLINITDNVQTVTYTFVPHIRPGDGGAECTAGVPVTVSVTINPFPRIAVTSDGELCYSDPAKFDVTKLNTVNPGSTWYYDVSPVIYPAGVTGDWAAGLTDQTATGIAALTDNIVNNTNDVQTVTYIFTPRILPAGGVPLCSAGVPVIVTININPRPRIAVITDAELCYDGPARFDVSNPNTVSPGATWFYNLSPVIYPAGVTGDWAAGLTDQTATGIAALTDNLVNNTNNVQTVTYTFTPHIRPGDGGPECREGVPITVIVNINPRPRIAVITDAELCYDNPATFGITNPNTVHTGAIWYYDVSPVIYPAGVTGDWAAGFTDLTATGIAALTDNLVNNTNDVQTVIYTFTPHIRPGDGGTECGAGVAVTVTVHINPRPRIDVAADGDICYDEPGRFDITNLNTVNAGATWYYDVSTGNLPGWSNRKLVSRPYKPDSNRDCRTYR